MGILSTPWSGDKSGNETDFRTNRPSGGLWYQTYVREIGKISICSVWVLFDIPHPSQRGGVKKKALEVPQNFGDYDNTLIQQDWFEQHLHDI